MSESEPKDRIVNAVRSHERGRIGPSDTWISIANAAYSESPTEILNSLSNEERLELCDFYLSRPPAIFVGLLARDKDYVQLQRVCSRIVEWCEAEIQTREIVPEPSGMIRVRVENDKVVGIE